MGRPPQAAGVPAFRFLPHEVAEMEKLLEGNNWIALPRPACDALAETFSNAPERYGQVAIQGKQVFNWFQNRRHAQKVKMTKGQLPQQQQQQPQQQPQQQQDVSKFSSVASPQVPMRPAMPQYAPPPEEEKELEFEARSARDGAWYDVTMFLSYRDQGKPEVRVRFAGFGPDEDEWVDVETSVRLRSVPCEVLECAIVLKGDHILCFQEGSEQALYYDAVVVDIQRRRHDMRGCRCRFWVRYQHDLSEEVVPLKKICRRPDSDLRFQQNGRMASYG